MRSAIVSNSQQFCSWPVMVVLVQGFRELRQAMPRPGKYVQKFRKKIFFLLLFILIVASIKYVLKRK